MDGRPLEGLPEGEHQGVYVLYATTRGANAADDRIVELLDLAPDPDAIEVVTSDRALVRRVTDLGACTLSAGSFLRRLDKLDPK
jgi:predicted RNA-binding protein with PIN domain